MDESKKVVTIYLPTIFDYLLYKLPGDLNRSEMLRAAIKEFLEEEKEYIDIYGSLEENEFKIFTVNVDKKDVKALDLIVKSRLYPSRSELIRYAVRNYVLRRLGISKKFEDKIEEETKKIRKIREGKEITVFSDENKTEIIKINETGQTFRVLRKLI